jgi:hypothetical protein
MLVVIDDEWVIDDDKVIDYHFFNLYFNQDNYYY